MCDVAANVTDAIFPSAPVRQWVLSLPFELRGLAATKPDVLTARGGVPMLVVGMRQRAEFLEWKNRYGFAGFVPTQGGGALAWQGVS
jgi:hypothetical protein